MKKNTINLIKDYVLIFSWIFTAFFLTAIYREMERKVTWNFLSEIWFKNEVLVYFIFALIISLIVLFIYYISKKYLKLYILNIMLFFSTFFSTFLYFFLEIHIKIYTPFLWLFCYIIPFTIIYLLTKKWKW
jgi:hypothetical protein